MPYGTIKIDTITFTDAGVDKSIAVSGLVQNPTFTGNVTATGTISGATVRATTVSGVTVSGTTANFASGVFTTQISGAIYVAPAGTAGAPSVQVGTGASIAPGLYSPATDQLGISTGGSFRLVVDSTGRVGIGTSSPISELEVGNGSVTAGKTGAVLIGRFSTAFPATGAGYFQLSTNNTDGSNGGLSILTLASGVLGERLRIDSSGRVGIGTTAPTLKLSVDGDTWFGNGAGAEIGRLFNDSGVLHLRGSSNVTGLALGTNGAERVRIDSSGRVGIGTSSPQAKLHVETIPQAVNQSGSVIFGPNTNYGYEIRNVIDGSGFPRVEFRAPIAGTASMLFYSAGPKVFYDGGTTEQMRIDSSGNVLIGTSASRGGRSEFVSGTLNINADYSGSAASFVGPGLVGTSANRATVSVEDNSAMAIGVGGSIGFGGRYLSASAAYAQWAAVAGKKETGTSGEYGGYLGFYTRTHGTNAIDERMRIDSTGRVGIGTSSPAATSALEVSGNQRYLSITANAGGGGPTNPATSSGLHLSWNRSNGEGESNIIYGIGAGGAPGLAIGSWNGTTYTERLRIDSSGNVGIGTSSPQAKLHVNGTELRVETTAASEGFIRFVNTSGSMSFGMSGAVGNTALLFDRTNNQSAYVYNGGASGSHEWLISNIERMRIDSTGRVGIGTSSPQSILHLAGTSPQLILDPGSGSTDPVSINSWRTNAPIVFKPGDAERVRIDGSGRLLVGTTAVTANASGSLVDIRGNLSLTAASAVNGGFQEINFAAGNYTKAAIRGYSTSTTDDGELRFYTAPFGDIIRERLRIDSTGRVGIGTSSPAVPLQVLNAGTGNNTNNGAINLCRTNTVGSTLFHTYSTAVSDEVFAFSVHGGTTFTDTTYTKYLASASGVHIWYGPTSATERMRIDSNGRIFVACTSSPSASVFGTMLSNNLLTEGHKSSVNTTSSNVHWVFFNTNGAVGSISTSGSATAYNTSSDYRLKENIEAVADGITRLKQLNPSRFNFITDPDRTVDGFIAHEVQVVVPEAITGEKDAEDDDGNPIYQGIDQSKLVPLLTAALQEAIAKIETLEAKVAVLESA